MTTDTSGAVAVGKRLTNHSARKYLVQKLSDAGLPPNQIVQVSFFSLINQHKSLSREIVNR